MSKFSDFLKAIPSGLAHAGEAVLNFFGHLFGTAGKAAQEVLEDVSDIANAALPIVKDIALVAAAADPAVGGVASAIIKYLPNVVTSVEAVEKFASDNASAPLDSLLHNAAVFLTQHTKGFVQAAVRDLNLGVELAYNIYRKQTAAK